jgi:hypothetical protein
MRSYQPRIACVFRPCCARFVAPGSAAPSLRQYPTRAGLRCAAAPVARERRLEQFPAHQHLHPDECANYFAAAGYDAD